MAKSAWFHHEPNRDSSKQNTKKLLPSQKPDVDLNPDYIFREHNLNTINAKSWFDLEISWKIDLESQNTDLACSNRDYIVGEIGAKASTTIV